MASFAVNQALPEASPVAPEDLPILDWLKINQS
jgi:hypothetical protein